MRRLIAALLALALCAAVPASAVPGATVVDGAGRTLAIPDNRTATTIASVYAVSVPFLVALELTDRVVAINVKSKFWTTADAHLAAAGSVGRGVVDLEALASYAPGVLIHRSNDAATVDAVTGKLGIEVLCLTVEDMDDIVGTLEMMGAYFGAEDRAREISRYLTGKFDMLEEIVRDIPMAERKTALVMGGELGRVAGGDMLQSLLIERAGGVSVATGRSDNRNWTHVGVETVFDWNPDVLFFTSSTVLDYRVDALADDPVWRAMNAVKNGQLFTIPAKIDSWDMPGVSCALGAMYMLHAMYPDRFSAERLQAEIDEYYTLMFGQTFDPAYLGYELAE